MSNHFQYSKSINEMFSRQKSNNNQKNEQAANNIYESPQRHLKIPKRQFSFNNNKMNSPLQCKKPISSLKMQSLPQLQQQLKSQTNPSIVNCNFNNINNELFKYKENIFTNPQSDMAIENFHHYIQTSMINTQRNYQELQINKSQSENHYQVNTNQPRKINEIQQSQFSENLNSQNLLNPLQYQSTQNQDIEYKIKYNKDQQHQQNDSMDDEYDGDEEDQYLESPVGKFLNKNQQINCYSPYSPGRLRNFIQHIEPAFSQKIKLELSAEQHKIEVNLPQSALQSKDQISHNQVIRFNTNQIQGKSLQADLQNIYVLQDITNQQTLIQEINKNSNIPKFDEQNICDNYLQNQLKNNQDFKMEINKNFNLNFSQNNLIQQKEQDENNTSKKEIVKDIQLQQNNFENMNGNFQQENKLNEKKSKTNTIKTKKENLQQQTFLNKEKEIKKQIVSHPLIDIKEENINKQQEGERLFQKLERTNESLKGEENLINLTPFSKQILQQFNKPTINEQQIDIEGFFKQYLKDTIGFIENNQTDLQEQIVQNTSNIDEINTKMYQDLNRSFDSFDSENEQSSIKKKSVKQKQSKKSKSISQFYEEMKPVVQMKPKFLIHSEMNVQNSLQKDLLKINSQLSQIQNRQAVQNNAIFQIIKQYKKLNTEQNTDISDIFKSPFEGNPTTLDSIQKKVFQCKFCLKTFSKSCSLGGHISRVHKGKSDQYKEKQKIREKREMERKRKIYFKSKGQCLNDENSNVSIEESELKTIKNNNPSEKKLIDSTQMDEENSQDIHENEIQTKKRIPQNDNQEFYLENDYTNFDENEKDKSQITKKIRKYTKRQQQLKDQDKTNTKVNKILFSNNQYQSNEYICQNDILSQNK